MSLTTITIGAINYVSNASVAEADAFLAVDPVRAATWTPLTDDQKGGFLVAATRRFNPLPWQGEKTGDYDAQADAFPRTGLTYPDGTAVTTTDVPQEVEDATIILAGSIAIDPTAADHGTSGTNVKGVGAGSARVEFFRPSKGTPLQEQTSYQLIKQWLQAAQDSDATGSLASGTGASSSFSDIDEWGRNEGFP